MRLERMKQKTRSGEMVPGRSAALTAEGLWWVVGTCSILSVVLN